MANSKHEAIRHLERNILGSRYLLEVYKIAYNINSKSIGNNQQLASLLGNTYLRSLILNLCVIFNKSKCTNVSRNISLCKSLEKTFNKDNLRPLKKLLDQSVKKLQSEELYKIRNKKIAHLDLEDLVPSRAQSDPGTYEELVSNAETIISEILKEQKLEPERAPPNVESDPALQQLQRLLIS